MNECIMCDVRNLHLIPLTLMCVRTRSIAIFRSMSCHTDSLKCMCEYRFFLLLLSLLQFVVVVASSGISHHHRLHLRLRFLYNFISFCFEFGRTNTISPKQEKSEEHHALEHIYTRWQWHFFLSMCVAVCFQPMHKQHSQTCVCLHTHTHTLNAMHEGENTANSTSLPD